MRSARVARVALAAAALAAALPLARGVTGTVEAGVAARRSIEIASRPISALRPSDPARRRFGGLDFLGGLVLTSRDPGFGGLSGLRGLDHGRGLLAISDQGRWVSARLDTDADGRPKAVAAAEIAPLLDDRGRPLVGKDLGDAESLTLRTSPAGVEAFVGFERRHRILAYRAETPAGLLSAAGHARSVPADVAALPPNEGLEALADAPDGRLVAIAETAATGAATGAGAVPGWILDGRAIARFRLADDDGFAVTDAAFLPSGDLLVLQRRFSLFGGLRARLVRVAAADLVGDRAVRPTLVFADEAGDETDNMEGLCVDVAADGSTLVTLVSDDNFLALQRTLLLRFRLVDEAAKPHSN